ncbi:MAG: peptide ABC transporter substrate-binding protein [Xanthomonadales bacterium]|nr:peptide ABC transporter substrate-binding protein [Gammaproteobacteria bacterium]MBT8052391.1 peptide ABC transporter substrate-binding protein [Gammaproteobacteria bacterium]NND55798.1 peptide ABC transporter substrate-binding protein [Xanthomonadales bacterium]NNK50062.1 peptide ABC transporter substrate-binding protein [Xanthomonadales bacterium]
MNCKVGQPLPNLPRRKFLHTSSLALLGLAGGGIPGISRAVGGDVLHIRNYQDLSSLDPVSFVSSAEGMVMTAIFQNLLQFRSDGSWDTQPDAAEYFEQLDATRYAFRLKPGQMFTNGHGEMTADDVKFSFERVVDPSMHALNLPDMGPFSHVEVHDRYSGVLVLRSPYAAFIPVAVAGPTGVILSRHAVTAGGGRFTTNPPACSGPYRFKSWQAQRKTVLERNPLWPAGKAPFSQIHVYAMTDEKAAEMAFEAGQLDCARISVESTGPFERDMPPGGSIRILPSGRNYWLGMNRENSALADIRIRQAIQYAIDAQAVVEAAWFGLAPVSTGPIPEGMIGHRERSLIPPAGNPQKARQLLTDAGVTLPLRLRLDVNNAALELTAVQVMQWSLKKVGIEVEIRAQDSSTFLTIGREAVNNRWRDVQLFMQSFTGMADPYYSLTWFSSSQLGIWNWERFSNEEFDRLNQRAIETTDPSERSKMYRHMQDLMEASGCYRFITNGVMPQIYRNTIEPAFRADGYAMLRNIRPAAFRSRS